MADHVMTHGSVQYLRAEFTYDAILPAGVTVNLATDYVYEVALTAPDYAFDAGTATWLSGVYATALGKHYVLALIGDGTTIDPDEGTRSEVRIRATAAPGSGLIETPVIYKADGYCIVEE
jgi:hypothetical protein